MPTPITGWWTASLIPLPTSFERPLVTRFSPPEWWRSVGDEQLRVPEDVSCDPLLDPDDGEDQRHQDKLSEQGQRPAAAPVEAGERDGEQAERKVEREQLDRALAQVLRPGKREAGPAHEGCERQRDG